MLFAKIVDDAGVTIGIIQMASKDFKTGSKGYFGQSKVETAAGRLQVQIQAVIIGSKPEGKEVTP